MKANLIAKSIFIYIILVQTLYIITGSEIAKILVLKFTLFELGVIAAFIFMAVRFILSPKSEILLNKIFLYLILGLVLYQIIVIIPLLYIEGLSIKETLYSTFRRSYFLVIPFIYFYVLPAFKNNEKPIMIINVSGLILVLFFIINYLNGFIDFTSTGEARIAPGVSTIIFALMLINNLSFFSGQKNNYFFITLSLLGFVFANHKSAYLGLAIISLFAFANLKAIKNRSKTAIHIALLIVLILIPLSQIPFIADNFWGRITSSFTTKDPNAESRLMQYEKAWEYFMQNPINGSMVSIKYYADSSMDNIPPHSFIFQLLASQGIVGFTWHLLILFLILFIGYRNRKDPYSFQMFLVTIFYVSFTILNENFYSPNNIMILNFACAMILFRNKCIENAKKILTPYLTAKIEKIKEKNEELVPTA